MYYLVPYKILIVVRPWWKDEGHWGLAGRPSVEGEGSNRKPCGGGRRFWSAGWSWG